MDEVAIETTTVTTTTFTVNTTTAVVENGKARINGPGLSCVIPLEHLANVCALATAITTFEPAEPGQEDTDGA